MQFRGLWFRTRRGKRDVLSSGKEVMGEFEKEISFKTENKTKRDVLRQ